MLSRNIIGAATAVAAVALFLGITVADAQSADRTLRVETITTYPPFDSKDPATNKMVGFDIELVEALAAKIGANIEWIEASYPQVTSFSSIKTGRADLSIAAITDTPERHELVNLLDYIYFNRVFFTRESDAGQYASMDALCGKRVGAARSSVTETQAIKTWSEKNCVAAGKPAIDLVPGDTTAQVKLMLQQDRIDAAITGAGSLGYWNKQKGDKYVKIGKSIDKALTAIAFSKDNEALGQEMKKALSDLMADGSYARLLASYGLSDEDAIEKPMINGKP